MVAASSSSNPSNYENYKDFKDGCKACLPIVLGYCAVAVPCGALGVLGGLSLWQIALLTFFLYAGAAQLVLYSLLATHADLWQITLSVAFVNSRYLLTNTYLAKYFKHSSLVEKLVGSLLITDETFGATLQYLKTHNDVLPFYWLLGLGLTAWFTWVSAAMVGAVLGSSIPGWAIDALGFSLVGMFIGLLILSLHARETKLNDLVVVVTAIVTLLILRDYIGSNFIVIVTALISAVVGVMFCKFLHKYKTNSSIGVNKN